MVRMATPRLSLHMLTAQYLYTYSTLLDKAIPWSASQSTALRTLQ